MNENGTRILIALLTMQWRSGRRKMSVCEESERNDPHEHGMEKRNIGGGAVKCSSPCSSKHQRGNVPKPRAATSVARRIGVLLSLNSEN
jgi:hypothetical protein